MTDNKKLIEEAREHVPLHGAHSLIRRLADALEAAEKAHTPTEDEREAQRTAAVAELLTLGEDEASTPTFGRSRGKHTDAQMLYMICLALDEGLEGVANIDLPDLIVKMISEHWGTADADTSPEEPEAALAQLAPYIPDHMRTPEAQGEPSGAQVEFPFTHEGVTLEQDDGGLWVQIDANEFTTGEHHPYWIGPRALAALRAAGEV